MEAQRIRRRYDHRFREFVRETDDIELAVKNGVLRSTARDRLRLPKADVVSMDLASMSEGELRKEVALLRERNEILICVLRLFVVLMRISGVTLKRRRVSDGQKKRLLLGAIDRAKETLSLRTALRVLGLSKT